MFKRIILAITLVAAFGVAGLGMSKTAEARHGCHRGYHGGYGYSAYHAPYSYGYYGPRYRAYRSGLYSPYYYRAYRPGGVYFSIGF